MADDEILTIREVASLRKIGEKTTYTTARSGQLPGFEVRGQWRFRRTDIDQWITRQVDRGAGTGKEGGGVSRASTHSWRGGMR